MGASRGRIAAVDEFLASMEAEDGSSPHTLRAYRTDLADAARAMIEGDLTGEGFTKGTVEVTEGGE